MKATNWEFTNRALAFGLIFAFAFPLYAFDQLILREEAELQASQGERYQDYRKAVARLWPSLWPRIASAGRQARWSEGWKAEFWYWGFAAAGCAFAITLSLMLFFGICGASIALFWMSSIVLQKKSNSQNFGSPAP